MPRARLFWKLFLATAGLNLVGAVVIAIIIAQALDPVVHGSPDPAHSATAGVPAVDENAADTRHWLWSVVAVEFLCVAAVSYWFIARAVRPLSTLNAAADALAAGDYGRTFYVPNTDELGKLASTLNRVSQAMHTRTTQISQQAARQSTVLGGMVEGVVAVDARQRIVLANEAARRLFDFRPPTVEGRPLLEVIRNHELHGAVTNVFTTSEPLRLELRRPGPPAKTIDIHVQPLPGEPCEGVVLVIHDTTALRRLEAIRSEFVANVSHELKTPLSSIKAYAETLRSGAVKDHENCDRFLGRIEEQTERLTRLIMDMLMLARIESDHQAFDFVSLDVPPVVKKCIDDHRRAADAKRITLHSTNGTLLNPEHPFRVRADREGLREILDNLVDNAIKYTPEDGKISITWSTNGIDRPSANGEYPASNIQHPTSNLQSPSPEPPASNPQPTIRISVCDSGIGIKPEDQERIFERFYRVDKARSRELGGTGLGLSIVKHLAHSMDGMVTVSSKIGQGSTFTIELPQA